MKNENVTDFQGKANDEKSEEMEVLEEESYKENIMRFEECKKKHRKAIENMTIEIEDLEGKHRYTAEQIGIEAYRKMVDIYGGGYNYVPQYSKLIERKKKSYVYEVFLEYGADFHKTAVLCGLSVSTVRRYIKDFKRSRYDKARNKKKMN